MIEVPMKRLLETGVHFGHQPRRWNPKMEDYIFTTRKGVHIIDLQQTIESIQEITEMVTQRVADGDVLLFVGTKRQCQDSLEEHARRCNMPYVNNRWLGGTLTNFKTIRKSVDKLKELERMEEEDILDRLSNKEARAKERERNRLQRNLEGIRDMESLPDMIFVTDILRDDIAVKEAKKLGIPVIGILDTNCDPDNVNYGIPGNDDAIRALGLYSKTIADAVVEGKEIREKRMAEEQAAIQAEKLEEEEIPAEAEVIKEGGDEEIDPDLEPTAEVVDGDTNEPQSAETDASEPTEEESTESTEDEQTDSASDATNQDGEESDSSPSESDDNPEQSHSDQEVSKTEVVET